MSATAGAERSRSTPRTAMAFGTLASTLLLVIIGCGGGGQTQQLSGPLVIRFDASAGEVEPGSIVTLRWHIENADTVTLVALGEGTLPLPPTGSGEGAHEVTVARDTTYLLTAQGPDGEDARQLHVRTRKSRQPEFLLMVTPPEITAGQTATLVWNTGEGRIPSLRQSEGATLDLQGQGATGSLPVQPMFDTDYTLEVEGRTVTASLRVLPAILHLSASSPSPHPGQPLTLTWKAGGATRLTLSSPGRGTLVEALGPAQVEGGSFVDIVPAHLPENGVVIYELVATHGAAEARQTLQLYVGLAPALVLFEVPATVPAGSTFDVVWRTEKADRVQLLLGGRVVYQSPSSALAAEGRFTLQSPTATSEVELRATNSRGGWVNAVKEVVPVSL